MFSAWIWKENIKTENRPSESSRKFCFVSFKALEKLKRQLAEAEAELEARKKPPEDAGPRVVGEGLVIDEWVRSWTFGVPFISPL
jgi:hypothetical protein